MEIHPTALVDPSAKIAADAVIHPYCIIGPNTVIGPGNVIESHVVISGRTTIGSRNHIYSFTSIGNPPQDITYAGEDTQVVIGDDNIIRENVTIHRGTMRGGGITRIGNMNYLMAFTHVAHDCVIGNSVIMASGAILGGHVHIDDHAVVGGVVGVHQFVRIGSHSYIGGVSGVSQDVAPFTLVAGPHATVHGLNITGLKRKNFSAAALKALKKSFKILFRSNLMLKDALQRVREEVEALPEIEYLLEFFEKESKRGITRRQ